MVITGSETDVHVLIPANFWTTDHKVDMQFIQIGEVKGQGQSFLINSKVQCHYQGIDMVILIKENSCYCLMWPDL